MVVPARVLAQNSDTLTALYLVRLRRFYYTVCDHQERMAIFRENYSMRKICASLVMLLLLNSCAHVTVVDKGPRKAPPGQVKKMTGSQSAKPYAPGQQKKKN